MKTLIVLLVAAAGAACNAQNRAPAASTPTGTRASVAGIAAALRAEGVEVKEVETLEQPFYPVPAHVFTAGGEDLQLYEFPSAADADRAAAQVDPRGSTIGTTKMSWLAPAHFFRRDRVIAIHLGYSPATRAALERVMGKPFAGHD